MAAIRKSRGEARARLLREMNGVPAGYLTTGGAAAYLGVTHAAVWLAYQKGRLAGEKFGNLACFTQAALDAYAACRRKRGITRPVCAAGGRAAQIEADVSVQQMPEGRPGDALMPPDDLIPVKAAAREKGVSLVSLYRAIKRGRLTGVDRHKVLHVSRTALDTYRPRRRQVVPREEPREGQNDAPIPPSLTEQVRAALAAVMRAQRTADDGQPPRLCVLPRSDGSAGVYYRHPERIAYAAFVQIAGTHLAACQAVLEQAGFAVELCAPTAEGAPCWLWVRAR